MTTNVPTAVRLASWRMSLQTNSHRAQSPYSFKQTPYDFMGGMWTATLDMTHMISSDAAAVLAWVAGLDGVMEAFTLPAVDYAGPFGLVTANPTFANAALVRGKTIVLQLAAGDSAAVGDYVTIAGHLHIITTAAAPDVSDQQSVGISPRLRADVVAGAVVEMLAPYGTWALAKGDEGASLSQAGVRSRSLSLNEAL
jgi:hypothetical protein